MRRFLLLNPIMRVASSISRGTTIGVWTQIQRAGTFSNTRVVLQKKDKSDLEWEKYSEDNQTIPYTERVTGFRKQKATKSDDPTPAPPRKLFEGNSLVEFTDVIPAGPVPHDEYFKDRFGTGSCVVYATEARKKLAEMIAEFDGLGIHALVGQSTMGKSHALLRIAAELRQQGHFVIYIPDAELAFRDHLGYAFIPFVTFALEKWAEHLPSPAIIQPWLLMLKELEADLDSSPTKRQRACEYIVESVQHAAKAAGLKSYTIIDQYNHLTKDGTTPEGRGDAIRVDNFCRDSIVWLCASITANGSNARSRSSLHLPDFVDYMSTDIILEMGKERRIAISSDDAEWIHDETAGVAGEVSRFLKQLPKDKPIDQETLMKATEDYMDDAVIRFSVRFKAITNSEKRSFLTGFIRMNMTYVDDQRFFVNSKPMCPAVRHATNMYIMSLSDAEFYELI